MIVKHLDDVIGTAADVDTEGWTSRRLIYKDAGMGYSVNDTIIKAGAELTMEYKNHFETVYCIEGAGEITDLGTGETHELKPGVMYALNDHDRHIVRPETDILTACVFNPPLNGKEQHDENGVYALRANYGFDGMTFETENDTEVAAAFISHKLQEGEKLGDAMEATLTDLDGFFTFVVGTKNGFGVVRDPIACKPAVMAETDQYVAFGSEYRALVNLPGIETARIWEPEPATVYFWER